MNFTSQGLQIDHQIAETEKEISVLVLLVLDLIEICCDTAREEKELFDLQATLLELRIERACLPSVSVGIPELRYA